MSSAVAAHATTRWRGVRRLRQSSLSLLGLVIVVLMLLLALASPLLAPYPGDVAGAVL